MKKARILSILIVFTITIIAGCGSNNSPTPPSKPPIPPPKIELPKTGQTTSYYPGDDGDLEVGVQWPIPRFIDYGDGTVTDNLTGLMWKQTCEIKRYYWSSWDIGVLDVAKNSNHAGYSDWRIPSINELVSLINVEKSNNVITWLNSNGFALNPIDDKYGNIHFWTCNPVVGKNAYYWRVNLDGIIINNIISQEAQNVLLVRGSSNSLPNTGPNLAILLDDVRYADKAVKWPNPRFIDNNNTITDLLTGLMWEKSPNTLNYLTWEEAIDYAQSFELAGFDDWRVPNILELLTLINYDGDFANLEWLKKQGFEWIITPNPYNAFDYYWTSTSDINSVVTIQMISGNFDRSSRTNLRPVILVRGGRIQ